MHSEGEFPSILWAPVIDLEKMEPNNSNIHRGRNPETIFYFHCQFCVTYFSFKGELFYDPNLFLHYLAHQKKITVIGSIVCQTASVVSLYLEVGQERTINWKSRDIFFNGSKMYHQFSPYVKGKLKEIVETSCILAIERNFWVLYFIYR